MEVTAYWTCTVHTNAYIIDEQGEGTSNTKKNFYFEKLWIFYFKKYCITTAAACLYIAFVFWNSLIYDYDGRTTSYILGLQTFNVSAWIFTIYTLL